MKQKTVRRMKRILRGGMLGIMLLALGTGAPLPAAMASPSYRTVTEVFDWGPSVSKVIVDVEHDVRAEEVDANRFRAHVKRTLAEGTKTMRSVMAGAPEEEGLEGDRAITAAYISDGEGNKAAHNHYVTLELAVGPDDALGSAVNFDVRSFHNDWVKSDYTITDTAAGTVIRACTGDVRPQAAPFTYDIGNAEGSYLSFPYASYEPRDGGTHPLIIWLHGMGEGGVTPSLTIMGNKAVQFADESIQQYFGGAYVLAPQAATYWMQGTSGFGDGTSVYENDLMAFLKRYVDAHPGIDKDRIYLGGDSNGGYMTMLLVRDNPGYFAAAFPTCEALADRLITEKDLKQIAKTPLWFTAAQTDEVVSPKDYVVPTVERLKKCGADVHFSFFDNVVDETGRYQKADGTPYEYPGHWSWIYVYNDRCETIIDGRSVKLFDWLSEQHR